MARRRTPTEHPEIPDRMVSWCNRKRGTSHDHDSRRNVPPSGMFKRRSPISMGTKPGDGIARLRACGTR